MKNVAVFFFAFSIYFHAAAQRDVVDSGVYRWNELPTKEGPQRVGRKIMEGSSPHFSFLEIHATTQEKGAKPSPAHTQEHIEEIIIIKEGLAKITMNGVSKVLAPESVAVIPPSTEQTMENIGDSALTYYVMMFTSKKDMDIERGEKAGGPLFVDANELTMRKTEKGGVTRYFNRSTAMCENLEMHLTQLNNKGPSHDPHSHFHSEIILVIEGETEMTIDAKNYKGTEGDLFLMKSNEVHSITNVGETPCRYFAFGWQ